MEHQCYISYFNRYQILHKSCKPNRGELLTLPKEKQRQPGRQNKLSPLEIQDRVRTPFTFSPQDVCDMPVTSTSRMEASSYLDPPPPTDFGATVPSWVDLYPRPVILLTISLGVSICSLYITSAWNPTGKDDAITGCTRAVV